MYNARPGNSATTDCDQVPYYKNSLKTLLLGSEAELREYQEEGVSLPQVVPPQLQPCIYN